VGPAQYASYAGVLGLAVYSLSSGFPIFVIAVMGESIQSKFPKVLSVGDFVGFRFGPTAKLLVVLLVMFNMSIGMLAEYTTMGSLFKVLLISSDFVFSLVRESPLSERLSPLSRSLGLGRFFLLQDFVGTSNIPIIVIVGAVTLVYTAYGGLFISLITDRVQGVNIVLFIAVLSCYIAATFRAPLPADFGPSAPYLGPNFYGYSSIVAMPVSLMSATVFSEAFWQRCWASQDKKALYLGAGLAWGGPLRLRRGGG
jgi:Na+/proline symporter